MMRLSRVRARRAEIQIKVKQAEVTRAVGRGYKIKARRISKAIRAGHVIYGSGLRIHQYKRAGRAVTEVFPQEGLGEISITVTSVEGVKIANLTGIPGGIR